MMATSSPPASSSSSCSRLGWRAVASVRDVVLAFGLREAIEQFADAFPKALSVPRFSSAEQRLEFGEDLLDRIEVRRVGRQEAQLGAGALDGIARGFSLVAAEIVENDDVARPQARDEDLLDISGKAGPLIGPSKTAGALIPSQRKAAKKVEVFQ
jgi:hypothetical protein